MWDTAGAASGWESGDLQFRVGKHSPSRQSHCGAALCLVCLLHYCPHRETATAGGSPTTQRGPQRCWAASYGPTIHTKLYSRKPGKSHSAAVHTWLSTRVAGNGADPILPCSCCEATLATVVLVAGPFTPGLNSSRRRGARVSGGVSEHFFLEPISPYH